MKSRLTSLFFPRVPLCLSLLIPLAPVRAATVVWTNTAGGNWSAATNWSPNAAPASGDTVILTNDGTYAVTVDVSPTLNGLTMGATNGTQTLNLNSGTLTLNGPATLETNAVLNLGGGTLTGTGTIDIRGPFNWTSGTLAGAGSTILAHTAPVNFSTAGSKWWRQRTVFSYATVNYTGGGLLADSAGVWHNTAGATFLMAGDMGIGFGGAGGYSAMNNAGTLRKSTGAGLASVAMVVNNTGTVQAQSGQLSLDYGGVSSGLFQADAGATNMFGGQVHTLLAGTSFNGGGLFRVAQNYTPSTLSFAAPLLITNRFELNNGGTIGGTNVSIFAGPFTWIGGQLGEAGKTVFTNSATVSITTANTKWLRTRTVDNYTTVTYPGTVLLADNYAVWNNQPGAVFEIQNDYGIGWGGTGGYATFNNSGLLKKSAGSALASVVMIVNNAGTVLAQTGQLSLDAGGTSTGLFQAEAGATNQFGGLTHTLLAGTTFTGPGLFRVLQNYTASALSFAAPLLITNRFELNNGGTIGGTNVSIFAGPFTWIGGQLGEAGKTVFTNSATVSITTANTKWLRTRTVDNYTTVTYPGTVLLADNYAVWNNQPGAVFDIQNDYGIGWGGTGGYATFNNSGLLKKSAGSALADTQLHMRNAAAGSRVRSQTGILGFSVSYIQTNGLTELAGGNFSGALFDIRGGTLSGAGNLAANVLNNGTILPGGSVGRLTISNNVAQTFTALSNSVVTFEIGGLTPGTGHDQLRVNNGTATLAGTLRAVLANGHLPTAGNTYTVMTFTARSGLFTNFSFLDYDFGVVQNASNVILIASNALPAVQLSVPTTQLVCTPFQLQTAASDLDGAVTNLSVLLGTNVLAAYPDGTARKLTVEYDCPGLATFTARATDNKGAVRETNFNTLYFTLPLHNLNLGGLRSNGVFKLCMLGETGSNYVVLAATNVDLPQSNWTTLGAMANTNGIWRYLDNGTLTNRPMRYYRAQQVP